MTLPLSNIKFVNSDADEFNFVADYFDADDNETYTLNISYRPNDDDYEFHIDIAGQSHTDDVDTIEDSQYFDDDAIAFIVSTVQAL